MRSRLLVIWMMAGFMLVAPAICAQESEDQNAAESSESDSAHLDVVHLISGKRVSGTVLIQSGGYVVLEVYPGVPLRIPSGQVKRVELSGHDRNQDTETSETGDGSQAKVVQGVRMNETLGRALSKIVPEDDAANREFDDVIQVIEYLGEKMDVPVSVAPEVRNVAPEDLSWNGPLASGLTFYEVVQEDLAKKYRGIIRIELADERIRVLQAEPSS